MSSFVLKSVFVVGAAAAFLAFKMNASVPDGTLERNMRACDAMAVQTRVAGCTALFSRSETLSFGGPSLISTAARDRVKLAIDQCEEQFHVYDDKSTLDTLDSYEAALNRGKAAATVWTCDFSFDYVKINAEYRT